MEQLTGEKPSKYVHYYKSALTKMTDSQLRAIHSPKPSSLIVISMVYEIHDMTRCGQF